MPFADAIGAIAGPVLGSVAGGLVSSAMSPGTSGGSNGGSYYVPTGLPTADQTWQALLAGLNTGFGNRNLDQYALQSLQNGYTNNSIYGPAYQNAANSASVGYTHAGDALTDIGNLDMATQRSLLGAGQNVYQMGLDPQNALYDRTLNQLTQQTGATNSMYGLGSSAAGAGVQNQALSNFNIDWQNNQLSRALQGLQGYAGAANTAGSYGQAGANALTQAPQYTLAGGSTPYNVAQTISGMPGQLANTYGSFLNSNVYGPAEGLMNSIIQYMTNGNGAQAVPFQSQAQGAGALGSMVSQGISGALGNYFGGSSTPQYFGSTQSPGNYAGTGYGGYGLGSMASPYYSGGGDSYGFTMG
ncbi:MULTISPECIES: hypothetical protein [Burkholderia cepacia complex]|uniref:hypothetical protein n=1 Tax=Burkholderia cepacia complex TaxID=87882 RepID=UPI001908A592|nr:MULTISPECIES: hypothetical protein [Burkholderia cepacia complex]MBK1820356.1 hypothetical protein [Burkholderia orbicola]MCA7966636.1 hypothetical protein [Burkholderia cenocepacia]MDR8058905.1 hypothetical protein [Burkholderia cenocepacia]MDR8061007.1 hypothetical protein [Burkholderia cenocepacia]